MICLFQKKCQKFWLHLAQSHVGVSVVMMARPIVTQEAWKNNHHVENAGEDDGDDHIETGTNDPFHKLFSFCDVCEISNAKM